MHQDNESNAAANDGWSSFAFADAQRRVLHSRGQGAAYDIRVWLPPFARSTGAKLPVVYALDGNGLLGTLAEAIARTARRPDATNVGPAIVVAISRTPAAEANAGRHSDYTSGASAEEADAGHPTGGAAAFLEFLETQLLPLVERDFAADPSRRVLLGHSLAGYFVLHALTTRPELFAAYAAISPSIWWDEPKLRAGLARVRGRAVRVSIAVGEWEGELPPWQRTSAGAANAKERRKRRAMIERATGMAAALRAAVGPDNVEFHVFPNEDHASVVLAATARALRFVLQPS